MLGQIAEVSMHLKKTDVNTAHPFQVWLQESPAVRLRVSAKVNNGEFVQTVVSHHTFFTVFDVFKARLS